MEVPFSLARISLPFPGFPLFRWKIPFPPSGSRGLCSLVRPSSEAGRGVKAGGTPFISALTPRFASDTLPDGNKVSGLVSRRPISSPPHFIAAYPIGTRPGLLPLAAFLPCGRLLSRRGSFPFPPIHPFPGGKRFPSSWGRGQGSCGGLRPSPGFFWLGCGAGDILRSVDCVEAGGRGTIGGR